MGMACAKHRTSARWAGYAEMVRKTRLPDRMLPCGSDQVGSVVADFGLTNQKTEITERYISKQRRHLGSTSPVDHRVATAVSTGHNIIRISLLSAPGPSVSARSACAAARPDFAAASPL